MEGIRDELTVTSKNITLTLKSQMNNQRMKSWITTSPPTLSSKADNSLTSISHSIWNIFFVDCFFFSRCLPYCDSCRLAFCIDLMGDLSLGYSHKYITSPGSFTPHFDEIFSFLPRQCAHFTVYNLLLVSWILKVDFKRMDSSPVKPTYMQYFFSSKCRFQLTCASLLNSSFELKLH